MRGGDPRVLNRGEQCMVVLPRPCPPHIYCFGPSTTLCPFTPSGGPSGLPRSLRGGRERGPSRAPLWGTVTHPPPNSVPSATSVRLSPSSGLRCTPNLSPSVSLAHPLRCARGALVAFVLVEAHSWPDAFGGLLGAFARSLGLVGRPYDNNLLEFIVVPVRLLWCCVHMLASEVCCSPEVFAGVSSVCRISDCIMHL